MHLLLLLLLLALLSGVLCLSGLLPLLPAHHHPGRDETGILLTTYWSEPT
jgi:hypothetical protein